MADKILYFLAGDVATVDELADIVKLNTAAEVPYLVGVRNSKVSTNYGAGPEECDFVAGTIPTAYTAKPTVDPDTIGTGATVANGGTVAVRNSAGADSHNATAVVAGSTLTGVNLAATVAFVDQGDSVNVENSAGNLDSPATATVAAGVLTNVRLAATKTIVTSAQALTGVAPTGTYTNTVTFTVANGVISAIALS